MAESQPPTEATDVNPYAPPSTLPAGLGVDRHSTPKMVVPPVLIRVLGCAMVILIGFMLLQDGMLLAAHVRHLQENSASALTLVVIIVTGLLHLFLFSAAQELIRLRSFQLSWYAAVLLCFPCFSPLSCVAMPLGIVSVILLRWEGTRDAFSKA